MRRPAQNLSEDVKKSYCSAGMTAKDQSNLLSIRGE